MRRRGLLALGILPATARAQPGRLFRVGALHASPWHAAHHEAMRGALARLGFVEGGNLELDRAGHGLAPDAFAAHAAALARARVDAIHVTGDAAVEAARAAAPRIPILALADDLVARGFAAGFAQPGGTVTGISIMASDLDGKRQELLLDALPEARRIGALVDAGHTPEARLLALRTAAARRGVEFQSHATAAPAGILASLEALAAAGVQAVNVLASPMLFAARAAIIERMATLRLPAIYQWPDMAREGGLLAYGPSLLQLYRERIPQMLVRLLHGARPELMPIELPTHFALVANVGVARRLDLLLPDAILARAEEVIE